MAILRGSWNNYLLIAILNVKYVVIRSKIKSKQNNYQPALTLYQGKKEKEEMVKLTTNISFIYICNSLYLVSTHVDIPSGDIWLQSHAFLA